MQVKEKKLIIKTLLNKISLTTKRSGYVYIKLKKFGTFHTHGNKKRMNKLKYLRKYNKKLHAKNQHIKDFSIESLLFVTFLLYLQYK
jgi:hypothetical protein